MGELPSPDKHSSDLLNRIIDHAHLTGRDYLMALMETRTRDAAVANQARLALLEEIRVNADEWRKLGAPCQYASALIELQAKYAPKVVT